MEKNLAISALQRGWRIVMGLFWRGWGFFGLSVMMGYGLSWWPGDRFLPVQLFHYFMPWLLVGLIPGLLVAGLARRKWVIMALAAPTLLISLTFAPLFLPRPQNVLAASESFKVMSYNVYFGNRNIAEMASLIRQEQPDILLIQELTPSTARALKDKLADLYPDGQFYMAYEKGREQGVISRFPLTPVEQGYNRGRTQKVIATTPVGPIAVWNIHLSRPVPWWRWQYRQLSGLVEDIAAVDEPLILGGDFNTTDQSEAYRLVSQYLQNAHWEASWGFGFSFPANQPRFKRVPILTPMIRIDHIFANQHFYVRSAGTLNESGGSDHFPVIAELSLVK